jgi:type VI secretion system protein ImpC
LSAFIERVVRPHLAAREDPRLAEWVAKTDEATSEVMRAILHHPDFQALEAAWRAVFWLARELETGTDLKLYLLDITRSELAADPGRLRRLLVDGVPGADPWAVVVGNYTFGRSEKDIALLGELAEVMAAAEAPLLAESEPADGGGSAPASRLWAALRGSRHASWIGLALPRFLLRLPYGAKTDPVEGFAFEEMPARPEHAHYLWGNPAFACAYLLGQAFRESGWNLRPGEVSEIRGLPLHAYEADGEQQLKPCAEVWMTERDAEWILEAGAMPLASLKNQDAVRLLRFQSIADPPAPLSGRWQ